MSDANRALAETFLRMLNEHDPGGSTAIADSHGRWRIRSG